MPRLRSLNIDADYDQTEVVAALNLIISLTDDIAGIMRFMSPLVRKQIWLTNATSKALGKKLLKIDQNLDDMDPRE